MFGLDSGCNTLGKKWRTGFSVQANQLQNLYYQKVGTLKAVDTDHQSRGVITLEDAEVCVE